MFGTEEPVGERAVLRLSPGATAPGHEGRAPSSAGARWCYAGTAFTSNHTMSL
jgi:hypothetical protein